MPYNNTPIQPPKEYSGAVSLPLARVKKIIHADDEIQSCSNNAAFVITIATEMFIQHLVERTHEIVKAEKRPRRNVQYTDISNAVARLDNLEFLSDVIPRTTTYAKHLERKKRAVEDEARAATEAANRSPMQPQQLSGHNRVPSNGYSNATHHSPSHGFSGPGAGSAPINLLDDGEDRMDLDGGRPSSRHQQIPTTMELLERARAAQARAELGLTHSPSLLPLPGPAP